MVGAILHYLLAFVVAAATIVVNAAVSLTAMYLIVAIVVWLAERFGQERRRRKLGLPRPLLRYRIRWALRRHHQLINPDEQTRQISAFAAMEMVQALNRHPTFSKHGAISVADGKAASFERAVTASSHPIRECWVVYAHNKKQGPSDGSAYLIGKRSGNLLYRGAARDIASAYL